MPATVCAVQPFVQPVWRLDGMSKINLRDQMPVVVAFIDSLRAVFGKEGIDKQIQDGMRGKPTFWASENGHEIGTRLERGAALTWDAQGISYWANERGDNDD